MLTVKEKSDLCIKCQACCKLLSFSAPVSQDSLEFFRARGVRINFLNTDTMYISIPHICAKLTSKGCSIYPDRPLACKVYDGSTHITVKDVCLWNKEK